MSDIFVGLDQELGDKLVDSLKIPFTVDALNSKYFKPDVEMEPDDDDQNTKRLESDLYNVSIRALQYAETRKSTINQEIVEEDQELYEIASTAVDSYLSENQGELEEGDKIVSEEYDFTNQKGLWDRIKKYSSRALNWLKRQAKKVIKLKSIELERFKIIINKKPNI